MSFHQRVRAKIETKNPRREKVAVLMKKWQEAGVRGPREKEKT
jgi:hypothetical protein